MRRKSKPSQGAKPARVREGRADRADQPQRQYSQPARNGKAFDVDQHIRAINRAMCDAYVMFKDWPACIRYSYFVGPDGRLIARCERRAGA